MKLQFRVPISCATCGYRSSTDKCTNPDLILPDTIQSALPPNSSWKPIAEAWKYCDGAFWTESEDE
jgi:hypothetical protein